MIKAYSLCAMSYEGIIISTIGLYTTIDECKKAVREERQVYLRYYRASLFHGGEYISSVNIHIGKDWEKKAYSKKDFTKEVNVWIEIE